MGQLLTPTHLMVIAVIAFLLFGGNKLPELGKGLGEGLRGFKVGIKVLTDDINDTGKAAQTIVPKPNESPQRSNATH